MYMYLQFWYGCRVTIDNIHGRYLVSGRGRYTPTRSEGLDKGLPLKGGASGLSLRCCGTTRGRGGGGTSSGGEMGTLMRLGLDGFERDLHAPATEEKYLALVNLRELLDVLHVQK